MVMCWAPDCKHYNVRDKCKFFRFPTSRKERQKWKRLLRRDVEPGPGAFICSCHFRDGEKKNGPEIFLHNIKKRFEVETPSGKKRRRVPSSNVSSLTEEQPTSKSLLNIDTPQVSQVVHEEMMQQPSPSTSKEMSPIVQQSSALEAEMYFLKQEVQKQKEKIEYLSVRFCYENIKGNDKLVVLYTGLPNSKIFEALYTLIKDVEIDWYLNWKVTKLEKIDQLLLAIIKLRLNYPHLDLAQRFSISQAAVTNIVISYVHIIYEILYKQLMSQIPSRQKNKSCLPSCFSKFTNCRIVLDCTEIFTVTSRKSMKKQSLTYSAYKHHNTFKGLVGVAPNGVITYVSDLYVGSTSDRKIVEDCGILNQLKSGDLVLADKGFLIQSILPSGVSLNIPPFLRMPQFTPEQVQCTENIARARIHVERAIQRMKCYNILNFLPQSLYPYADVVFKAVAALTNLQYPLIKEVEEFYRTDD